MSGAGLPSVVEKFATAHRMRVSFEKAALGSVVGIVVAFLLAALLGALWPPAAPHVADWGASIVARVKDLAATVATLCATLTGAVAVSFTRGAHDLQVMSNRTDVKSGDS